MLPSFKRCPLHFIRKLLVGEKQVNWFILFIIRLWNCRKWLSFSVPKYAELKVEDLWNIVKQDDELFCYFPDYEQSQLPERSFILKILWTLREDDMRNLIQQARSNRSTIHSNSEDQLIAMKPDIRDEFFKTLPQKSKF